jgi:GH3 auxin-responsive promoter
MIKIRFLITHLLWLSICFNQWVKFQCAIRKPKRAQLKNLQKIMNHNQQTEYGIQYQFKAIKSVQQFKNHVPITTYEDYRPYIEAIKTGDDMHSLTSEIITLFEPTSGSSSASKLIPYTATLSKEFQNGIGPWLFDLYKHRKMRVTGTSYWSITPLTQGKSYTPSGIPIGFEEDSQYFGKIGKQLIDQIMSVPKEVKYIQSVESFKYITVLFLLRDAHLNLISVWNPTFLVMLLDELKHHWNELIKDIEHGTITVKEQIPDPILQILNKKNKPNKKRAKVLKKISPTAIKQIWPKLTLVSCWTEANAEPYYQDLQSKLGPIEIQGKGLLSTECFISFPLVKEPYSILSLNSHFFEFLPLNDPHDTKLLDELEVGLRYIPIVTTSGGLYRYNLSDIIEVMGFKKGVPLLKFIGRQNNVVDHFGEKLNEAHVSQVLARVFQQMNLFPTFYMVAFDSSNRIPHYTLYLELDDDITIKAIIPTLVKQVDELLDENFHYHYCKKIGQLGHLRLFQIHSNGKESYINRLQAQGMKLGNIKPTTLSPITNWNEYFNGSFTNLKQNSLNR